MSLPSAFSVQVERSLGKGFFLNATAVKRINTGKNGVRRENMWAVTPRFENRLFEFMMPFVVYERNDPRLGAAMRIGFLTIGSDNLGSIIRKQNFSGSDVYVAIKVNPTYLKRTKKQGSGLRCPSF